MLNTKKLLACFLVFVLLTSVLGWSVYAAGEDEAPDAAVTSEANAEDALTPVPGTELSDEELLENAHEGDTVDESEEMTEEESEDDAASEESEYSGFFKVGDEEYNFSGSLVRSEMNTTEAEDSAQKYLDNYEDNMQNDPDFEKHAAEAVKMERRETPAFATIWSLLPAVIAIGLALITKEVYSSLFVGIVAGGLIWSGFDFEGTVTHVFSDGFVASAADSYNMGILVFLVMLGALVAMMNKAGGSAAFGRWAKTHIKSRVGAQIATIVLGCLIFIDDYFNCLTVGSVMRPVADQHKISRAKLAYLIDATAAPVCIIAPISSWAAAVAGFAAGAGSKSGIALFVEAIPFNFYALLTIAMMLVLAFTKFDYGPMAKHEKNAANGDLFTSGSEEFKNSAENVEEANPKGIVGDLIIPVVFLIFACVIGMVYSGGYYTPDAEGYGSFIVAFSNSDASVGLVYGSFITVIFSVIYFLCRRVLSFKKIMECIPEGFKAMVPAIMILVCAWTLKTMTDSLGAKIFISQLVKGSAAGFQAFLPAIIFLIAVGLSFATGTSWGTFGILIPIVLSVFSGTDSSLTIVSISACMAGAVCGDHCSPISDTTIMASAGSQSNHLNHVSTQLPYALTVAGVSFICYVIAGFIPNAWVVLPIGLVLLVGALLVLRSLSKKKA